VTNEVGKPDKLLLLLVESGDVDAVAEIYDRHCHPVYSLALHVLREAWKADDVLHEVFMQLWREPSSFAGRAKNLLAALLAYTYRLACDAKRRSEPRDQHKLSI
jgi:RNA polymerase sigma-70 factor (ECF subfamily)